MALDFISSIAATATGMGAGLGNMLSGWVAGRKAKKMREAGLESWRKDTGYPEYEIPAAMKDYQDLLGLRTRQEMPGYSAAKSAIGETTAAGLSGVRQLASGDDRMAGLLGLMSDRQRSLRELGIQASQYRDQAQREYIGSYQQMAPYQERQWEYNQNIPWQIWMNEQQGLKNMGAQMVSQGWDQMMGAGVQGADLMAQNEWMNRMYPQPQPTVPTYTNMGNPIGQLGQQQVQPAQQLGSDPYANKQYNPFWLG